MFQGTGERTTRNLTALAPFTVEILVVAPPERVRGTESSLSFQIEWSESRGERGANRRSRSSNVPGLVEHALGNRCETPHHLLKKSLSSKLIYEQRVTFLTFDPTSQQRKEWNLRDRKDRREICG